VMGRPNKNDQSPNKEDTIIGIKVIESIVDRVTLGLLDPIQTLSAIKEILYFHKFLPESWKKKAYHIFMKIWDKKQVIISTATEAPKQIYEISFDDRRIESLMEHLSEADRSAMYEGKSMLDLSKRGLHSDVNKIREEVKEKYGFRGLNISYIISTGDINFLLDEIDNLRNKKEVLKVFNWWADNYQDVSFLISREDLSEDFITERIVNICKLMKRNYILIHFSSNLDEAQKIQVLITDLFEKGKVVKYKTIEMNISDIGFCKVLNMIIYFE